MNVLTIEGNQFLYNGKPIQLITGALHYFRVVPEYWHDRLVKLKACGFNGVETYVPWNLHQPEPEKFNFSGMADIGAFIETAAALDLFVIVRPSPYICSEWEFGGLPAWLLEDDNMRLRCSYQPYLDRVDAYYDVLMPKLKPYLATNGGPVIAMQIENEYGSYGNDTSYLEYLRDGMINRGIDVLLFTSDGYDDFTLQGGMIPGTLETLNFGSQPEAAFAKLIEYQPDKPLMCMEYWNGWFDHWGEQHHTRGHEDVADVLDRMLAMGASVNFYMFHGGTNFGFYNGANYSDKYEPTVTSYDYNALLTESGAVTDKYYAIREIITRYTNLDPRPLPEPIPARSYGEIRMNQSVGLFESLELLSSSVRSTCPEPMEKLGQAYGFILYTTYITGPRSVSELIVQDVCDRALVFVDDEYRGVIERWDPKPLMLEITENGIKLSLLVENMGRINYGPFLKDRKGITEGVRLGQQYLFDWTIYPLPMTDMSKLCYRNDVHSVTTTPAFYRGTFTVDEKADTFLELPGWTKGVAYINSFNLGRYWEIGPQRTLYIPAPLLNKGENELVLFELHCTQSAKVTLRDRAVIG